jgi:hypothetical protein
VWRFLYTKSGFDLNNYVKTLKTDNTDLRTSPSVNYVTHHMKLCLDYNSASGRRSEEVQPSSNGLARFANGYFLPISYVFVKLLYLAVALLQLVLINYWLSDSFYTGKWRGLWSVLFGSHNWQLADRFPRMTLCKFQVYILTDQQSHWVQCTLPVNIYIEKIYLVIYAWLWAMVALIAYSFVRDLLFLRSAEGFLTKELEHQQRPRVVMDKEDVSRFRKYLGTDGVVLLKLIKENTNRYYSSVIAANMFKQSENKQA